MQHEVAAGEVGGERDGDACAPTATGARASAGSRRSLRRGRAARRRSARASAASSSPARQRLLVQAGAQREVRRGAPRGDPHHRNGRPASGAYAAKSEAEKPMRPLLATKAGMPLGHRRLDGLEVGVHEIGRRWPALNELPSRTDERAAISSRYVGSSASGMPSDRLHARAMNAWASSSAAAPSTSRVDGPRRRRPSARARSDARGTGSRCRRSRPWPSADRLGRRAAARGRTRRSPWPRGAAVPARSSQASSAQQRCCTSSRRISLGGTASRVQSRALAVLSAQLHLTLDAEAGRGVLAPDAARCGRPARRRPAARRARRSTSSITAANTASVKPWRGRSVGATSTCMPMSPCRDLVSRSTSSLWRGRRSRRRTPGRRRPDRARHPDAGRLDHGVCLADRRRRRGLPMPQKTASGIA